MAEQVLLAEDPIKGIVIIEDRGADIEYCVTVIDMRIEVYNYSDRQSQSLIKVRWPKIKTQ